MQQPDLTTYRPVIGLEIHVQLRTASKMFCSSPNDPDCTEPNRNICEVCTAQPGALPVVNEEALKLGIITGMALNCSIPEYSKFDRKSYFYPDLPKGYQISQYDRPIAKKGYLDIEVDMAVAARRQSAYVLPAPTSKKMLARTFTQKVCRTRSLTSTALARRCSKLSQSLTLSLQLRQKRFCPSCVP